MGGILAARTEARASLGIGSTLIMCVNRDRPIEEAMSLFDPRPSVARAHRRPRAGLGRARQPAGEVRRALCPGTRRGLPPHRALRRGPEELGAAHPAVHRGAGGRAHRPRGQCARGIRRSSTPSRHAVSASRCARPGGPAIPVQGAPAACGGCSTSGSGSPSTPDDPGLFASGYLTRTLTAVQAASGYSETEVVSLMRNAFLGAWVGEDERAGMLERLSAYAAQAGSARAGLSIGRRPPGRGRRTWPTSRAATRPSWTRPPRRHRSRRRRTPAAARTAA